MQGIAKHRKATRQASGDGCLSSLFWLKAANRTASKRNPQHRSDVQSKAVSHWRRWFIEVFSLHGNARKAEASKGRERKRKATRPALHGGLSESFSAQGWALQNTAWQSKAEYRRSIQSNAARPFNEWLCRGAFLSVQCTATTSSGNNRIANRRNEPKRNAVSPSNRELIESL